MNQWNDFNLPPRFRLAYLERKESECKIKVGAVIVNSKPIAVGHNTYRTHPITAKKWTTHAEVKALLQAGTASEGHDLYVYRELRNGTPAMARPCDRCLELIIESGIKNIYYTTGTAPWWEVIRL